MSQYSYASVVNPALQLIAAHMPEVGKQLVDLLVNGSVNYHGRYAMLEQCDRDFPHNVGKEVKDNTMCALAAACHNDNPSTAYAVLAHITMVLYMTGANDKETKMQLAETYKLMQKI